MDNDETTLIEALVGPYAGQRLTVSSADAKAAVADGWARDPFAAPSEDEPKQPTEEQRLATVEAAEKAARKLRGEEEKDERPAKAAPAKTEPARAEPAMVAEDSPRAPPPETYTPPPSPTKKK